ncbi:PilN domain-containing protein [Aquipuribacter nitratireducens]|uniref:PilN domain-containing protein n=1 Tax=Aquipuribacter nitratireducens TaxID=650104 RepID=A0ABW0GRV6_9MICO
MSTQPGAVTETTTVVPLTAEFPLARVDLLPPEVLADRRFKKTKGWLALAVVGSLALCGGAYAWAAADANAAAEELAVEQARTSELTSEAAQYAEVPAIIATKDRAETALETAMASDIQWYRYLAQMASVTPEGVWFTNVTATANAEGAGASGATGDPLAPVDSVADVVTIGKALSYEDVATWMDRLETVTGYDHVLFSTTTLNDDTADEPYVDFQVSTKVLPEAYSDRYAPKAE